MADGKIHIPARKKQRTEEQAVVRLSPEAYLPEISVRPDAGADLVCVP